MSPGTWRVPVILLLGGLKKRMDWDWGSLLELGVCRSGVRTKTGINMGPLEESGRSRLIKEAQIGSDGITEQPKVPVTASSGIAPVSTFNPIAQSKQSDLFLLSFIYIIHYLCSYHYFLIILERASFMKTSSVIYTNHYSIYICKLW